MYDRSTLAYDRFWDGRDHIVVMSSKWSDVMLQVLNPLKIMVILLTSLFGLQVAIFDKSYSRNSESDMHAWRTKMMSLMSVLHATALSTLCDGTCGELPVLEGIDPASRDKLNDINIEDRVFLCFQWVQTEIVLRMKGGGLNIPSPMLSRVFQELSTGMLGYSEALKYQDTPFPFPYVQIILMALTFFTCVSGLFIHEFSDNWFWAVMFSFLCSGAYTAINEVAIQLEDLFGDDANDLNVLKYQQAFLSNLIQVSFMGTTKYQLPPLERGIRDLFKTLSATDYDWDGEYMLPAFQHPLYSMKKISTLCS